MWKTKAVRVGSLEPAHVTLAKQSILPFIAVLMLAICTLIAGQSITSEYCALALVAFLIAAQVFKPLDLQSPVSVERTRKAVSRILLEWGCVVAVLVFLAASFSLTHLFSREGMLAWFLCTPLALLLADSLCVPIAKRISAERVAVQRYIIIGANDVGFELARRLEQSQASGKFCGFFDSRGPARLSKGHGKPVVGNCSAADLATIVRSESISRVYLALPISTSPRMLADVFCSASDAGWNSYRDSEWRHIVQHNRIRADLGMLSNHDWSQDFGASTNVDMTANPRGTIFHDAQRYLLKY